MHPHRLAAALLAALALAGCGSDSTAPSGDMARVRMVNASPDAGDLDISIDGGSSIRELPYRGYTVYFPVLQGARDFQVFRPGEPDPVVVTSPTFAAGHDYSFIAANRLALIEALVLEDDNSAPAAGSARVRVVHAAPGAPALDIYLTGPGDDLAAAAPIATNIGYRGVAPAVQVPAGDYRVRMTNAGTTTVVIDTGTLTLAADAGRTVMALDNTGGGAPFAAVVLPDRN
ncbi:MAG TPA: DUF4397 domain-containing protein [Gemmatimonadales bacterium]|nr:DUF4397 domain-containing protein [Gemmatimonadales bacterium]